MKMGDVYDEAIDAGLSRREASFLGAAEALGELARQVRDEQSRFLEDIGLTWDDARALDEDGRVALNNKWSEYQAALGENQI